MDGDSYLQELTRYIHLNPVRARIVERVEEYPWSSYHEYIKKSKDSLIDKIQLERYFKLSSNRYKQFVQEGMDNTANPFAGLYAGFILGKEKFIKNTLDVLKEEIEGKDIAHKKTIQSINPEEIIEEVSSYYKKDSEMLKNAKNKPLLARKTAIYLMKKLTVLTNIEIGKEFGISYTAVSKTAKDVERLIRENREVRADTERMISRFKV